MHRVQLARRPEPVQRLAPEQRLARGQGLVPVLRQEPVQRPEPGPRSERGPRLVFEWRRVLEQVPVRERRRVPEQCREWVHPEACDWDRRDDRRDYPDGRRDPVHRDRRGQSDPGVARRVRLRAAAVPRVRQPARRVPKQPMARQVQPMVQPAAPGVQREAAAEPRAVSVRPRAAAVERRVGPARQPVAVLAERDVQPVAQQAARDVRPAAAAQVVLPAAERDVPRAAEVAAAQDAQPEVAAAVAEQDALPEAAEVVVAAEPGVQPAAGEAAARRPEVQPSASPSRLLRLAWPWLQDRPGPARSRMIRDLAIRGPAQCSATPSAGQAQRRAATRSRSAAASCPSSIPKFQNRETLESRFAVNWSYRKRYRRHGQTVTRRLHRVHPQKQFVSACRQNSLYENVARIWRIAGYGAVAWRPLRSHVTASGHHPLPTEKNAGAPRLVPILTEMDCRFEIFAEIRLRAGESRLRDLIGDDEHAGGAVP